MKIISKALLILIVSGMILGLIPNVSALDIESQGAVAVDSVTGTVLFEKNADTKMYPAGLSKIMTAVLTLEYATLDETVTISQNVIDLASEYGGSLSFSAGEELTVLDLLHCMLMVSSNEAAYALAEHIAGDIDTFTDMMNKKAQFLGLAHTHFTNPSGIHDENNYTTPRDMATLSQYASENSRFMEIVNTVQYRITPTNKNEDGYKFFTNNHLISKYKNTNYYYKYAQGIIGGYTGDAGYCLTSTANQKKGDINVIVVTMNGNRENKSDPIPSYQDTLSLFDYCFSNYSIKTVLKGTELLGEAPVSLGKTKDFITVSAVNDLSLVMPIDCDVDEIEKNVTFYDDIKAPVVKGDKLGTADIVYNGKTYATVDVYANFDIEQSKFLSFIDNLGGFLKSKFVKIGALIVFLLIAFYVAITVIANKRRQALMRSSRRRRRYK